MRGLIEEATHEMGDHDKGTMMDVVLIAAAQRVEHYEIAAYGTIVTLAKSAGQRELADLLGKTLDEEKKMDVELTRLAESEVNPAWIEEAGRRRRRWKAPTRTAAAPPGARRPDPPLTAAGALH